jgi:hypothetical protein
MRDKITKPIHDAMVVMRSENYSLCEIAAIFKLNHASVVFDLKGNRKTPYRPSTQTTIDILEAALISARQEVTFRTEKVAHEITCKRIA